MLQLVNEGVLTIEQLVALMCHHPASLFHIQQRGYIREGYWADLAIVEPSRPWALTKDVILSKCGWSPDRKSTRLNSSHANISYAVFCLKKKNSCDYPTTYASRS